MVILLFFLKSNGFRNDKKFNKIDPSPSSSVPLSSSKLQRSDDEIRKKERRWGTEESRKMRVETETVFERSPWKQWRIVVEAGRGRRLPRVPTSPTTGDRMSFYFVYPFQIVVASPSPNGREERIWDVKDRKYSCPGRFTVISNKTENIVKCVNGLKNRATRLNPTTRKLFWVPYTFFCGFPFLCFMWKSNTISRLRTGIVWPTPQNEDTHSHTPCVLSPHINTRHRK